MLFSCFFNTFFCMKSHHFRIAAPTRRKSVNTCVIANLSHFICSINIKFVPLQHFSYHPYKMTSKNRILSACLCNLFRIKQNYFRILMQAVSHNYAQNSHEGRLKIKKPTVGLKFQISAKFINMKHSSLCFLKYTVMNLFYNDNGLHRLYGLITL